jgi:hypothetical protein
MRLLLNAGDKLTIKVIRLSEANTVNPSLQLSNMLAGMSKSNVYANCSILYFTLTVNLFML